MKDNIDIKLINKRDVVHRQAIFRLRYHIYRNVFKNHHLPNMNHEQQMLTDQFDDKSFLFLAEINGLAVGTLRVTPFSCLEDHENVILKNYNTIPAHYLSKDSAIFSLFFILPEYNFTTVTKCLVKSALTHALKKNIDRIFIESREDLVPYYQQYQFNACSEWTHQDDYPLPLIAMMTHPESLLSQES